MTRDPSSSAAGGHRAGDGRRAGRERGRGLPQPRQRPQPVLDRGPLRRPDQLGGDQHREQVQRVIDCGHLQRPGGCQQRRGTRRLGQPAQHRRVRCQPLAGQAFRPCRQDLTHGHAASPQAGDLRRPVQRPHHPRTRRSRRRPPQPVQLRPAGTVRHHQQTVQAAAQLPARRCSPRPTRRPGSVVVDRVRAEVVQYDPDPHLRWVRRAQATNEGGELDPALAGLDVPVEPVGGQVVAGQQRADRRSAAGRHRRLAPPVGGPQGRRRNPGSCR